MRAIGVDLGSRRIGIAVSGGDGALALPRGVVKRSGDRAAEHRAIAAVVAETGAEVVVVGVPYSLDGRVGPKAAEVLRELGELSGLLGVPVETEDERLSSVSAERELAAAGAGSRRRRGRVDPSAAAVILQAWLDRR